LCVCVCVRERERPAQSASLAHVCPRLGPAWHVRRWNRHAPPSHLSEGLGFGVWGLGFGVWGLGFGVWV